MPRLLLRVAPLALALLLLAACNSGDSDPTSPTPEGETPTPYIEEIDLELAARLLSEGDQDGALAMYSAGAERGTEEEQRDSLWALARVHSARGDHSSAEESVETLRDKSLEPGTEGAALLLQGAAEYAQGDLDEAEDAFKGYLDTDGPSAPYALLYLAQIAHARGDTAEAIEQMQNVLVADLPSAMKHENLMLLTGWQRDAGLLAESRATVEEAVAASPSANEEAEALFALAGAAEAAGDPAGAAEALQTLVTTYPASYRSLEALAQPAGAGISQTDRALVLFRNRVNDQAATAYTEIAALNDANFAEAQYRLGVLSERFELWDDAIAHYDAAITSELSPFYAAQAMWDKATVLERLGRTDEAIAAYVGVAAVMPEHEEAGPGAFRAGMLSYQAGRPGDALTHWQTFLDVAPNAEERARANFWLAKTSEALGDTVSADSYYAATIEADPLDFHAFRARAILDGGADLPDETAVEDPDWAAAETWLADEYGPEDTAARDALFQGPAWLRINELLMAGMDERAEAEIRSLLAANESDPWLTYRLVRAIDERGRYWISSPAAWSFVRRDSPPALFRLVYPLPYYELASEEAQANGFSPLLLLALIRQESLYQPDAVSSAEALGLTQVIPTTADSIAAALGEDEFRYSDLTRPMVSLRFGAHYLGGQLEGFGGVVPVALSAYNGGPGNAARWWEAAGGDPDLFVETIDFTETRAYVELVLENYALYLYAYGLVDEPYLPD